MNSLRTAAYCLALGLVGCAHQIVEVSGLSTSPDGQKVVVVGAVTEGDKPVRPLRWFCARGEHRRLRCQPDDATLPLPRER